MLETSTNPAADLLADYHRSCEERNKEVAAYHQKSRVGQLVAKIFNPTLREQIKIVEAFESVPAARLSAAQNEGHHITF